MAEPAPLAGTPPSASRCAPMLSGDAPTIGAAKVMWVCKPCGSTNASLNVNAFVSKEPLTHTFLKPARVGVRADDIGAKRLEEARIPRDGG
jgi:hypothetical protein